MIVEAGRGAEVVNFQSFCRPMSVRALLRVVGLERFGWAPSFFSACLCGLEDRPLNLLAWGRIQ